MTAPADLPISPLLFLNPNAQAMDMLKASIRIMGARLGRKEMAIHLAMLSRSLIIGDTELADDMPWDNLDDMTSLIDDPLLDEYAPWMKEMVKEMVKEMEKQHDRP
jgi:hypothetical protein